MLTSGSNQYLRPEYLSPLPTTLDAKKSPLALLAQTCSNIGADTPSSKPLIPPVEKPKESSDKPSREKSTPSSDVDKSSFKPYDSIKKEEGTLDGGHSNSNSTSDKSGFRTPTSKSASPAVSVSSAGGGTATGKNTPNASSADSASSTNGKSNTDSSNSSSSIHTPSSSSANTIPTSSTLSSSSSMHSQHNRISIGCGNMFVEVNHHDSGLPKDSLSSHIPLGTYKTSQLVPPSAMLNPLANCTGCTQVVGHGMSVDPTGAGAYPPGMGAKPGAYPGSASLSPYVAYARVKTATGGTTLVPICRDPYCTNCQLSVQSAQLVGATCPSGCTQCTHEKAALGVGPPGSSPLSALSFVPGASQLYSAHNLLGSHKPYVCNWIAGDTYCGKRFCTSEELLQHLRTHTNLAVADPAVSVAGLTMLNPALSLPSVSQSLACHLHYSTAPSLTTMAGLHRTMGTYPTSLSPVGASYSSSRYHPYKPPYPPMPGVPLTSLAPHPSLGPYYSPYAMYGQRLGAAHP